MIGKKGDPKYFPDMVAYLDKQIGRILQTLDDLGIADNTIVIFLADNGTDKDLVNIWGDGKRIRGGKGTMTDRGTHVPLLVRWPGHVKAGSTCEDLVDFSDLFPTVCPRRKSMGGASLRNFPGNRAIPASGFISSTKQPERSGTVITCWTTRTSSGGTVELWEEPAEPNENMDPEKEAAARKSLQAVFDALGK